MQSNTTTLVIDTGPDFRHQLNAHPVEHLDAVLYTHAHGDHAHGIDELRVFKFRQKMDHVPAYSNAASFEELKKRFYYMFEGGSHALYPPIIKPHALDDHFYQPFTIGDITVTPFPQDHGSVISVGFRFGDFAYSTDVKRLSSDRLRL